MKLGLILPTRHRAAYAVSAIRSLLTQHGCALSLIVSDNSSDKDEVHRLKEFCDTTNDPRLVHIRSPQALPMPTHWNWAIGEALAHTDATHYGIQYDRKVWKPDHLRLLAEACAYAPELLVTYACDFTYPATDGIGTWQMPASGKLYEVQTRQVIHNAAKGRIYEMGHAFPVLSNCMIPRAILERVRSRFGNFCDSSTPDTAFTFRFCAMEDRYLHFDRALVIVFGFDSSNGLSLYRGETNGTWKDFEKLWGHRPWAGAAPIPDLRLGQNVSFHEYNLVRQEIGERFPPIEHNGYLRELARALAFIQDPARKADMRTLLEQHGWRAEPPPLRPSLYKRVIRRLTRRPERKFANEESAIEYLLNNPRPLTRRNELLEPMKPVPVP